MYLNQYTHEIEILLERVTCFVIQANILQLVIIRYILKRKVSQLRRLRGVYIQSLFYNSSGMYLMKGKHAFRVLNYLK